MDERKRLIVTAFERASLAYDGSWNRCFDLQGEALIREARIPYGTRVLDVATETLEEIGRLAGGRGIWMDVSAHIGVGVHGP
jgi:hypothetical protein